MARRALPLAAIAAVALALACGATAGGVNHRTIQDSFSGSTIDQNVWAFWGGNDASDVSISQTDNALRFSIGAGAINDFASSISTRCSAHGDFDARLAFNLPQWPIGNGVWVMLMAANTGGFNAYRVSWAFQTGDSYGAFFPPSNGFTVPATTGASGTLRLTRQGSTWAGYYLDGETWVPLGSGPGPTSDIQFSPGVGNISSVLPFGGNPTTVDFDRFQVSADSIVC